MGRKKIENLDQFIEWVEQFKDGEYLYRGVPEAGHISKQIVISSAQYDLKDSERTSERLLQDMRVLIEKARSFGHHRKDTREFSDLELLAELQHFRAATCLIDFTYNALVALWFACGKSISNPEKDGKVVVLRSDRMEPLTRVDFQMSQEPIDEFFRPRTAVAKYPIYQWTPRIQNNRVIAQHSVFVFGGGQIKIDGECKIQGCSKSEIMTGLAEFFGIQEAHLFSDVQGFAWLHRSGKAPHIQSPAKEYRLRGIAAFHRDELDQAIADFSKSINDQKAPDTYILRALAYWKKGNANRSRPELGTAIKDCKEVIESYTRAINSDEKPNDEMKRKTAMAYNIRGNAYVDTAEIFQRNGEPANDYFDRAITDYTDAIELDPTLAKAYINRGTAYAAQENFDRAIADYTDAITMEPDMAYAYSNRAEARLHKKEWQLAIEDLKKAKDLGLDVKASFHRDYKDIEEFKEKNGITCVPEEIVEMLEGESR